MRHHNWCFTLNNWCADDVARLENLVESQVARYLVFGYETAPSTGTPHLQGYVSFVDQLRITQVKAHVGERVHLEAARGTPQANKEYCTKSGVFFERGTMPVAQGSPQGKIDIFIQWVQQFCMENGRAPAEFEYGKEFPQLFVQYRNNLASLVSFYAPSPSLEDGVLKEWQLDLLGVLLCEADDREVIFMVDPQGGAGKTWFQRYMLTQHSEKTQVLSIAKRDDIAHAIQEDKSIFLFNVPRQGMEFMQYTILEQLKDRMVFSPKYNSRTKILRSKVHVVVFCNEEPDFNKMTEDRYNIKRLSGGFNMGD
ncbi:MAG: putative viral replication protein [Demetevirus haddotis]|uniref:Viral replication protein n=1 Tax=Cressdnaviricota sp. TaxID=2748378 RepID=A0A345MPB6_9VIRU|nr:MAG: putative viral replication protein [Cressdnaviricota sp.]